MNKKILTIVMVILVILIIGVWGLGLKKSLNSDQSGQSIDESSDTVNDIDGEEEKNKDDDVESWGDVTEGIVDESVADINNTDKNTVDNNATDKGSLDVNDTGNISSKEYTITYILNNKYATIDATTQTVKYGQEFTLVTPKFVTNDNYRFVKWVITGTNKEFKSGVYTVEGDISLTAIWEDLFSKNY